MTTNWKPGALVDLEDHPKGVDFLGKPLYLRRSADWRECTAIPDRFSVRVDDLDCRSIRVDPPGQRGPRLDKFVVPGRGHDSALSSAAAIDTRVIPLG